MGKDNRQLLIRLKWGLAFRRDAKPSSKYKSFHVGRKVILAGRGRSLIGVGVADVRFLGRIPRHGLACIITYLIVK